MWRLYLTFIISLSVLLPSFAQARVVDATKALVNDKVITLSDVRRFAKELPLRKELDPFIAFFNIKPQGDSEITEYLVQERLISEKFPVEPSEVEDEIQNILKKNNIDEGTLVQILKSQKVDLETYKRLLGISLAKRKLMDRELRPLSTVTEDEVKNFYYTESDFIKKSKGKRKLLLSYDLTQLRIPDTQLAADVHNKIKSGQNFDAITSSLAGKGVSAVPLGTIREDNLSKPIRKSLEGLKVGEATHPVRIGETGLFVIHRINAISAPHDPEFERLKPQIQQVLYQRAMRRQLDLWTTRERRNAFVSTT